MILQRFAALDEAAHALGEEVASALRSGLAQRSTASLVVPGGRTPVPLFHVLREMQLDWSAVHVTLTDERWVPADHASSNTGLVRRELLQGRAQAAQFHGFNTAATAAEDAAAAVWQSLALVPRPFDAVVLGMGDDGHIASLFPHSQGLSAALDPVAPPACVAMRAPTEPLSRMSLNLAALLQTRRLFLFITGAHKRELLLTAAQRTDQALLPVAALLAQRLPMPEVYWSP
jgi:6-phosphogluconolactonase